MLTSLDVMIRPKVKLTMFAYSSQTGVSDPFDFEQPDDADAGGGENVEYRVPPPAGIDVLLSEHLSTPNPRYKVLSLVRSVIIEAKYPGADGT